MNTTEDQVELDSAVYKTLLESTRAIPWKIDWASTRFAYIGPQIEGLLGWSQDSWATVQDWAERIHPDDRDRVVQFCIAQSQAGVDHEADYRALTCEGDYVWIRDVVHVVRKDDGTVDALVGFMFDISERKRAEEQLLKLQRELTELSFRDGLTGVANRRRLDAFLDAEWTTACRERKPLSLVLADIDCFKEYNDCYGHLAGDACLKRVAGLMDATAVRGRGLLGRFGGEEFLLVLPDTDAAAARERAERCLARLAEARIPHERSSAGAVLTVSLGVATLVPEPGDDLVAFLEAVDRCLYQAKADGRNRVVALEDASASHA
ncbi:GGDEF domain-containing protein [Frateuria hangzhouensis]|uniref:GGDEF domain-containing protein n=1 Tax=Frateuria hangzhouensis TaxID=2995589 RepID=UPI0022608352|nr:diguanylate cyclase [Frateuria sp. STR12]MCX7512989.1 diguanylate cyclase [Frateuria sp. STR12]